MEASELREMSNDQLAAELNQHCTSLFRLRIQSQTERLDAPSELRRHRQVIARIKTIQSERRNAGKAALAASKAASS